MKIIENVLEKKKKIVNSIEMGNVDISLHYVFLLLNITNVIQTFFFPFLYEMELLRKTGRKTANPPKSSREGW